jgi:hypothetical protein
VRAPASLKYVGLQLATNEDIDDVARQFLLLPGIPSAYHKDCELCTHLAALLPLPAML